MSSAGTGKFAARVVDEHAGQAECRGGLVEGGSDLLGVTDVARHPEHAGPERLDRVPAGAEMLGFPAGDHHVGPQPGKLAGDRLAEPRSAAGDEDTGPVIRSFRQGPRADGWRLGKSALLGHDQLPV